MSNLEQPVEWWESDGLGGEETLMDIARTLGVGGGLLDALTASVLSAGRGDLPAQRAQLSAAQIAAEALGTSVALGEDEEAALLGEEGAAGEELWARDPETWSSRDLAGALRLDDSLEHADAVSPTPASPPTNIYRREYNV